MQAARSFSQKSTLVEVSEWSLTSNATSLGRPFRRLVLEMSRGTNLPAVPSAARGSSQR